MPYILRHKKTKEILAVVNRKPEKIDKHIKVESILDDDSTLKELELNRVKELRKIDLKSQYEAYRSAGVVVDGVKYPSDSSFTQYLTVLLTSASNGWKMPKALHLRSIDGSTHKVSHEDLVQIYIAIKDRWMDAENKLAVASSLVDQATTELEVGNIDLK